MKKKFTLITLLTSLIIYFIVFSVNYKIDVFGIHSKKEVYLNDASYSRYQNIGIARNYVHDTIITGTSLSENFKTSLSNRLFNATTIKIPMSGASAREQSILVSNAITENTKRIIWDFYYTAYSGKSTKMHKSHPFPLFLYDSNPLNDFKLYASFDILKLSMKYLLFKDKYFTDDFDKLYSWYKNDKKKFGEKHVKAYIENLKIIFNNTKNSQEYSYNNLKNNFDINILPIIKANPNIEFDFYVPPYTPYYFLGFYNSNLLNDIIAFKQYFIEKSFKYSNMHIHDFSVDYKVLENFDNYKDTHHFNQKISDMILKKIQSNAFLIDKDYIGKNIDNYKKYIQKELEKDK